MPCARKEGILAFSLSPSTGLRGIRANARERRSTHVMGALVLLNGHLGYVHTKGFCLHKNGDRARLCRADLESGASHIGKVLCYTLM